MKKINTLQLSVKLFYVCIFFNFFVLALLFFLEVDERVLVTGRFIEYDQSIFFEFTTQDFVEVGSQVYLSERNTDIFCEGEVETIHSIEEKVNIIRIFLNYCPMLINFVESYDYDLIVFTGERKNLFGILMDNVN